MNKQYSVARWFMYWMPYIPVVGFILCWIVVNNYESKLNEYPICICEVDSENADKHGVAFVIIQGTSILFALGFLIYKIATGE